jgi:uncharacterized protein YdhG (YjbR/CyaY superfamily)
MNNLNKTKVKTIDEYIAMQPESMHKRLEEVRQLIRNVAPEAEETISYNMPAFKFHGMLVGFAAWKQHCGFYPWNGHTVSEFAKQLEGFTTSSGAIQLPFNEKLPVALLKKIIKARIKENINKEKSTKKKK